MKNYIGFTLIEVLMSLFILSCALLELDMMLLTAKKAAKGSFYLNIAEQQIENMKERIYIYKNNDLHEKIIEWNQENKKILPNGHGIIQKQDHRYRLSLFWGEKDGSCQQNQSGLSGCLSLTINN